jgi:transposase InsO family protein
MIGFFRLINVLRVFHHSFAKNLKENLMCTAQCACWTSASRPRCCVAAHPLVTSAASVPIASADDRQPPRRTDRAQPAPKTLPWCAQITSGAAMPLGAHCSRRVVSHRHRGCAYGSVARSIVIISPTPRLVLSCVAHGSFATAAHGSSSSSTLRAALQFTQRGSPRRRRPAGLIASMRRKRHCDDNGFIGSF